MTLKTFLWTSIKAVILSKNSNISIVIKVLHYLRLVWNNFEVNHMITMIV